MKKRFKYVYYVVQTYPIFKICGYGFNKKEAEFVSHMVKELTGKEGKIIRFSRKQIKELEYTRV